MNPQTMSKRRLVEYLAHIGKLGFSLVETVRGYELVVVGTGQLVTFDSVAIIEKQLARQGERIKVLEQINVQTQADLARIELMMSGLSTESEDSMLREGELT